MTYLKLTAGAILALLALDPGLAQARAHHHRHHHHHHHYRHHHHHYIYFLMPDGLLGVAQDGRFDIERHAALQAKADQGRLFLGIAGEIVEVQYGNAGAEIRSQRSLQARQHRRSIFASARLKWADALAPIAA